jgi:LPXTG-motif cell wall-anchored protein
MTKNTKIALVGLGLLGLGVGMYFYFKNKATSSKDPQKNNRKIQIKRS